MTTVFRKTTKGIHEIETRAHRLSPRLRGTLILVDGQRSDAELRKLVAVGLDESLTSLQEQGFIEAAAQAAPAAPATAIAPSRPASAAPPYGQRAAEEFAAVRRDAVRLLNDQLGPLAEGLALKMERARDAAELRPLLETAEKLIASARGAPAAQAYRTRFIAS